MKHLWKAVDVIQFIVFFSYWKVNISFYAILLIEYAKNLAFFEFLQEIIGKKLNNFGCDVKCDTT